jgi:hypothetical protein
MIPTGNGSNGYESKGLENCEITAIHQVEVGQTITFVTGDTFFVNDNSFDLATYGEVYERVGGQGTGTFQSTNNWKDETLWKFLGFTDTTPSHNTINLDNSDSKASKRFYALESDSDGMKQVAMYTTEMAYDAVDPHYDGDSGLFTQLTDGTLTDDNGNVVVTSRTAIKLNSFKG